MKRLDYRELRPDWYAGSDLMARALSRELRSEPEGKTFVAFPRQWIPLFEWLGCQWHHSTEPTTYLPFFSSIDQEALLEEVFIARSKGTLRFLAELAASVDIVLCETLQRIDADLFIADELEKPTKLTMWHGYNRKSLKDFDKHLLSYKQTHDSVIFIPCSRARPYEESQSQKRLFLKLQDHNIDLDHYDKVVISSIGPIPEDMWHHEVVLNYDTGVRDLYKILCQMRKFLEGCSYETAIDVLPLVQYGDLIDILHLEKRLPKPTRPKWLRRRNIPLYK